MKLPRPFFRLPLRFDAARLQAEVAALPAAAWQRHPSQYEGNSAVRLISANGAESDGVTGAMLPTPHLQHLPYVRQLLAGFGVVWGRSRLMRLAPRSVVPEHADINYHWFHRVRVHIPVVTTPDVRFYCGDASVHMAAGECWVFDNWRLHRVENPNANERIHLVADTTGTAAFWQLVQRSQDRDFEGSGGPAPSFVPFDPAREAPLLTERHNTAPVMAPSELEFLVLDLRQELATDADTPEARQALGGWHATLAGFCHEWRSLWSLHGDTREGWPAYRLLVDRVLAAIDAQPVPVFLASNRMPARTVLAARVLNHAVQRPNAPAEVEYTDRPQPRRPAAAAASAPAQAARRVFDRPLFIVAAPRSGSTLLFETLACSESLWSLGDESHGIVEGHAALRPGAPGVRSNRLTAEQATAELATAIPLQLAAQMRNHAGAPYASNEPVRFLEKTPKNALRIPFFDALFPDAQFVFLWRDPAENISSIMEAWRSGGWVTYRSLAGWDGPWSLLLPPEWETLRGRPLEEVAAYQWDRANRQVMEDLLGLDPDRWMTLSYANLLADPAREVARICAFADLPYDGGLKRRVSGPLPLSRYTQSAPDKDKWRRNEAAIQRVLPSTEATLARLRKLSGG